MEQLTVEEKRALLEQVEKALEKQFGKRKASVSSDDADYQAYCVAHDYSRTNNDNLYK